MKVVHYSRDWCDVPNNPPELPIRPFPKLKFSWRQPVDFARDGLERLRMKLPVMRGKIDRRILANYRIDPTVMSDVLPKPFRPQIVNGFAVGGICLIRLKEIRPHFFPFRWGVGSENAAHRIAVEWDVNGETREGVYVPRRDSGSLLNTLVGGRIFPGVHHHASFAVTESNDAFSVDMNSDDGKTRVSIRGMVKENFPKTSMFSSLSAASDFFKRGSLGYSVTHVDGKYDGLELRCRDWRMDTLEIDKIESSYFDDTSRFPADSIQFDCALLMRSIEHEWHGREYLCCSPAKRT
jgi:hypothetical protein